MKDKKQAVYDRLRALGVAFTVTEHPAVYTIDEMDSLGITLDGDVLKNLFLRDAKGKRHFLVALDKEKHANLDALRGQLESSKLSFASEERLERYLGLKKGAVTPLGVFQDTAGAVEVAFDRSLIGRAKVGVHPNDNTATVWLSFADLVGVIEASGHPVRYVEVE